MAIRLGQPAAPGLDTELFTTAGEIVPPRSRIASNIVADASGVVMLTYFTAQRTEAIDTVTAYIGGTAAGATPTLCRMGIWAAGLDGALTSLLASSANDTTLFATINTAYPKTLTSTFSKVAGQRYACGVLVVTAAAMPSFHGQLLATTSVPNALNLISPVRSARVSGQTDLPNSVAAGSLAGWQHQLAMRMS